MGQFSWLYSDTGKQVVDNREADSFLLVPEPFQEKYGKKICQMDLNNQVLRTFKSLNEVHRILNFHIQCIRNAANHHTISYGYKWKWIYEV